MDAQAMMKMNDMVKNLTKHGVISNSEEAMEMASKMYNVEKKEESAAKTEDVSQGNPGITNDQIKDLIDRRLTYFIERNNMMIYKELQEIWTKLNQLGPEFEGRLSKVRQEMLTVNTQPQIMEQPAAQKAPEVHHEEKDHPRSGNYSENEVSVEKFFYCGAR